MINQKLVSVEHQAETTMRRVEVEVSFKTISYLLDKTNFDSGGSTNLKENQLSVSLAWALV
jgi:hypothetical protein